MDWINKYKVKTDGIKTIFSGQFDASAGGFEIVYQGDGGNADTYEITLYDGQYMQGTEPMKFTITGAWEIREVIEMFKLLEKIV